MRSAITLALLSAYTTAALPAGTSDLEKKNNQLGCLVVDLVVTALHAAPSATPFCSSYLGIQTSTVYSTATATSYLTDITISTTGTDTATAATSTLPTVTLDPITAPLSTVTETAEATTITTCLSSSALEKRHISTSISKPVPGIPTPACLKNLLPTAVSLACSCLKVPTPTSTSTVTQTLFPTTIVISDVAATTTEVPLETPYYTPVTTPITTVTVTPTSTVDYCPSPTPDTSCNNQGVQVAYYNNPFGVNSDGSYSQFDPTYFKTTIPGATSIASSAGGIGGSCSDSYSTFNFYGYTENCNYIALNYRGYLYAGQTGDFDFSISSADDIVLVWAGDAAYSGWTRSNALIDVTYTELGAGTGGGGKITGSYAASKGQYIPLRVLFAQGDGPYGFNIQVTAPDGTVVLDANSATSEFLVQYSCDGTSAPAYPAFGQEN